ncbi:hypothetical protein XK09_06275 [Campylobacter lanienae]|uniref:Transmembrane protein n=1 Tax=Campylobacter lanienae TaxID=75658 RepID=A0ABY3G7D3_9BACT|nr:hypothetical protein [Campylobacter lanienae]TWO28269.1 hypothetical protein XK09_06275 [Campylobacter lanienae]
MRIDRKFGFLAMELAFCGVKFGFLCSVLGWVANFCGLCFWVRWWNLDTTAEFGSGIWQW